MRNFSWEGVNEGGRSHLVKWEVVLKLVGLGGLGICLRLSHEALLAQ